MYSVLDLPSPRHDDIAAIRFRMHQLAGVDVESHRSRLGRLAVGGLNEIVHYLAECSEEHGSLVLAILSERIGDAIDAIRSYCLFEKSSQTQGRARDAVGKPEDVAGKLLLCWGEICRCLLFDAIKGRY